MDLVKRTVTAELVLVTIPPPSVEKTTPPGTVETATSPGAVLGAISIVVGLGVDLVSVICDSTADDTAGATLAMLVELGEFEVMTPAPVVAD